MRFSPQTNPSDRTAAILADLRLWLWSALAGLGEIIAFGAPLSRVIRASLDELTRAVSIYLLLRALAGLPLKKHARASRPHLSDRAGAMRRVSKGAFWRRLTRGPLASLRRGGAVRRYLVLLKALISPSRWIAKLRHRLRRLIVTARLAPVPAHFFFAETCAPRFIAAADTS